MNKDNKDIMENNTKVSGYRHLEKEEIQLINDCKAKGDEIGKIIEIMRNNENVNKQWLYEAEMTLKKGIMFLTRSIANPEGF